MLEELLLIWKAPVSRRRFILVNYRKMKIHIILNILIQSWKMPKKMDLTTSQDLTT